MARSKHESLSKPLSLSTVDISRESTNGRGEDIEMGKEEGCWLCCPSRCWESWKGEKGCRRGEGGSGRVAAAISGKDERRLLGNDVIQDGRGSRD